MVNNHMKNSKLKNKMRNTKQFLSTVATTVISALLVAGVVMATTTLSANIVTEGNLTVGGTAGVTGVTTLTGALAANGGIAVDTSAFTVADTTGNTLIAGTLGVTGTITATKVSINNTASTAGALKIHSHQMAATTDDSTNQYANEFKGEFLATSGTMDGIAAHYKMEGTGTGVMRSILGVAYLGNGTDAVTLSGDDGNFSWISGILGSATVANSAIVNGTAVTVTGVFGGLGTMAGATLTEGKYMSAVWADSQATQVLTTGSNQLVLVTNSGAATMDSGIKIANLSSGAITADITLQNGATIDNATDKVIALGGLTANTAARVLITGQRTDNGDDAIADHDEPENFLEVQGYFTGIGSADASANTRGIVISISRPASSSYDTVRGDTQDNGLKIGVTNNATGNTAGYTLRGIDAETKNNAAGSSGVTNLYGAQITAYNVTGTISASDVARFGMKNSGVISSHFYGVLIENESQGTNPADTVLLKLNTTSLATIGNTAAAMQIASAGNGYDYGIDMNGATIGTADIRLSSGAQIITGTTVPGTCSAGEVFIDADATDADLVIFVCHGGTFSGLTDN